MYRMITLPALSKRASMAIVAKCPIRRIRRSELFYDVSQYASPKLRLYRQAKRWSEQVEVAHDLIGDFECRRVLRARATALVAAVALRLCGLN